MERTGVLVAGEFRLFRDLVPGFQSYPKEQAVNQRFTGYAKGNLPNGPNPRISPHPGLPDDRTKDVYFWHSRKPIECAAIATVSTDGEWSVAAVGAGAPSAWSNPGISCLHADPNGGRWKPGETLRITNSIHFVATTNCRNCERRFDRTTNTGEVISSWNPTDVYCHHISDRAAARLVRMLWGKHPACQTVQMQFVASWKLTPRERQPVNSRLTEY
jgi:hypothetical protein